MLDFSCILYNQTTASNTEDTTASDQAEEQIDLLKKKCNTYKNSASCSQDELKALAYVIDKKILPSSITKNVNTIITKEQAVQIADAMR